MRFALPLTVVVAAAMANAAALDSRADKCTAKSAEALLKKNKGEKFCSSYLAKTVTVFETATAVVTADPQTVTVTSTPYNTVKATVTGVTTSTSVVPISQISTTTLKNPSYAAQTAARMAEKTAAPKVPSYLKGCKDSVIKAACGAIVKKPKAQTVTETITATSTAAGSTNTVTTVGATANATSFVTSYATQTAYQASVTSAVATATASIYLTWKTTTGVSQLNIPVGAAAAVAASGKPSTPFIFVPYSTTGGSPSAHGLVSGFFTTSVSGTNYCIKLATGVPTLDTACYTTGSAVPADANMFSINPNFNYVYAGVASTTAGTLNLWDNTALKWLSAYTAGTTVDIYVNNTAQFTA